MNRGHKRRLRRVGRHKGEYYPVDTTLDLMEYRGVMYTAKVSVLDKCAYGTVQHDDETYVCTGNTAAELVLDFQILVDALSETGEKAEGVKRAHKPDNGCEMPNPLNKMEYRGLTEGAEVSVEDGCLYGKILVEKDLVLYEGNTVDELEADFHEMGDFYLEDIKEQKNMTSNETSAGQKRVQA